MSNNPFFERPSPIKISEIAKVIDAEIHGDSERIIHDLCALDNLSHHTIASLHNKPYLKNLKSAQAGACILESQYLKDCPDTVTALVVEKPYRAFGKVAALLYPPKKSSGVISPRASIDPTAKLGDNCEIGDFVVIGKNCVVGENTILRSHVVLEDHVEVGSNCHIQNHVTLSHCHIGNHVLIKPGTRIGQQGFGFFMDEQGHFDIAQLGMVKIEDHVQIGANVTIDRGSQKDTIIKFGCRIDNLVQIAHNVEVGENSVLVAQVGIAGSTKLGQFVIVAGQVGIAGHLTIGPGVKIAGQSGVIKDVPPGATIAGTPAINALDWHRQTIALKKLITKEK